MKRYLIIIIISLTFWGCQNKNYDRIDYKGYSIGQKIDSNWRILIDNPETNYKKMQFINDTNFTCRTLADTIFSMTKTDLSIVEMIDIKTDINNRLKVTMDSVGDKWVFGVWRCIILSWNDTLSSDYIELSKCRFDTADTYNNWAIQIINEQYSEEMWIRHDPFY